MIARASQVLPPPSSAAEVGSVSEIDPARMDPEARLAELASLLARAALRATRRDTARPVAIPAQPVVARRGNARPAPGTGPRKAVDAAPAHAPPCDGASAPVRPMREIATGPRLEDNR